MASQFLVACHIIPSMDTEESTIDASNGILMTLIYARAFTEGLIGFDANYKIHLSSELKSHQFDKGYYSLFKKYDGAELGIKDVIIKPNPEYLEWHMDTIFEKNR
jgi:putative restriction endonuclease